GLGSAGHEIAHDLPALAGGGRIIKDAGTASLALLIVEEQGSRGSGGAFGWSRRRRDSLAHRPAHLACLERVLYLGAFRLGDLFLGISAAGFGVWIAKALVAQVAAGSEQRLVVVGEIGKDAQIMRIGAVLDGRSARQAYAGNGDAVVCPAVHHQSICLVRNSAVDVNAAVVGRGA